MKKISIVALLMCCITQTIHAGVLGDIDQNNAIGLPEAIYSLEVTAGMKASDETNTVDFKNYYFNDGAEFFYKKISFDSSTGTQLINYEYAYHVAKELNNVPTLIECWYGSSTYQEYYSTVDNNSNYYITGDYWNGYYGSNIQIGTKTMTAGDVYSSTYEINQFPYWCEYKCLGFEDIETPAGQFKDCLKMSKIFSYEWGVLFSHYYPNVGLVKQVYASNQNSFTLDLVACRTNTVTYPANMEIQRFSGTWTNASSQATDSLGFIYLPQSEHVGILILNNFPVLYQYQAISLESDNGSTFTPTNSNYNLSAMLNETSLSGTYTYSYWDDESQTMQAVEIALSAEKVMK